jgi:hypothetical protein
VQLPKTLAREIAGLHHLAYTPVTLHTPTADYARARRVIVIIIIQRRLCTASSPTLCCSSIICTALKQALFNNN